MHRTFRRTGLARLAAVAVALALSGALRVAGEASEPDHHRCMCPRGAHDCSCPVCLDAERRRVEEEALAALPPCHRAAAREAAEHRRAAEEPAAALRGRCGDRGPAAAAPASPDPVLLVEPPPLPFVARGEPLEARPGAEARHPSRPELPPPRDVRAVA